MTRAYPDKKRCSSGRERLIQAARTLAQHSSFDAITVDEIAKEAALSRPSFYYHFAGGKEELRAELVRRGLLEAEAVPDTRVVMLEAALRVFARAGVSSATLEDIAAEAGVSRGALSWHFHSKEDLLRAITEHYHSSPLRPAIESIEHDLEHGLIPDDEALLRRIASAFYDAYSQNRDIARLPILLLYSHPDMAQILAEKIVKGRKIISHYIQKRQEEGVFTTTIDATFFVQIIAAYFIMRAIGCDLEDLLPMAHLSREETINQLVSIMLYGIVRRDQPGQSGNVKQD